MKKIFLTLACAAMLAACASSPVEKLEDFVEKTEKKCEDFTAKDWQENEEEFEELTSALNEKEGEFTEEEMEKLGELSMRYMKIKMKQGTKALKGVGAFMNGMLGGAED